MPRGCGPTYLHALAKTFAAVFHLAVPLPTWRGGVVITQISAPFQSLFMLYYPIYSLVPFPAEYAMSPQECGGTLEVEGPQ